MLNKYSLGEFKNVYRPRTVDQVVSQPGIKKFFINAFATKTVPQVMLFEGPKGTGKTTVARIIAMGLNCSESRSMTPCGKCSSCRSILEDSNPDFKEINVADKTGVNDMRTLVESFIYTPMYLENKIFILDEAHMLTKSAQNKLLKDLEDTLDNIYIIFCTTETATMLPTLLDRCYGFKFSSLSEKDLRYIIGNVLMIEGKKLPDNIVDLLIQTSDGSARNLLTSLHKILMLGDDINVKEVLNVLGSSAEVAYKLPDIADSILSKDYKRFVSYIKKYNHKECYDLVNALTTYLGSLLMRQAKARQVSRLLTELAPVVGVANKGLFINTVYKYIYGQV